MKRNIVLAATGAVSLAILFSFGSTTTAEAQVVRIDNGCVYSTPFCPAVMRDANLGLLDVSGIRPRPENPVNLRGYRTNVTSPCGRKVVGRMTKGTADICVLFPLRPF